MALAQLGQRLEPVQAWQQNIHQHYVEELLTRQVQPLLAVLAPGHLEAAAPKMLVHIGTKNEIVFDGKYARMIARDGSHEYLQIILS